MTDRQNREFVKACYDGDYQAIDRLIKEGADDWPAAFDSACRGGHRSIAGRILEIGSSRPARWHQIQSAVRDQEAGDWMIDGIGEDCSLKIATKAAVRKPECDVNDADAIIQDCRMKKAATAIGNGDDSKQPSNTALPAVLSTNAADDAKQPISVSNCRRRHPNEINPAKFIFAGICVACAYIDRAIARKNATGIKFRKQCEDENVILIDDYENYGKPVLAFCMNCEMDCWPVPKGVLQERWAACKNCVETKRDEKLFAAILNQTGMTVEDDFRMDELPGRKFDFKIGNCIIEFDGRQHFSYSWEDGNFEINRHADLLKTRGALKSKHRYRIIRIDYRWLRKSAEYQTEFLRLALTSTKRLIVSDAKKYDWLKDMPFKPFVPPVVLKTVHWTEQKIAGYDVDGRIPTFTVCQCPAHGGDCIINVDELERIACQNRCLRHSALVFKSDSCHPDAHKHRKLILERCRHDVQSRGKLRYKSQPRPDQQPKWLAGTAPCPIHADCRIPADWLIYRSCLQDHVECSWFVFDGPATDHPQFDDYNERQKNFRQNCAKKERLTKADASAKPLEKSTDHSKQRTSVVQTSEPTTKNSKRTVADATDTKTTD